MSKAKLSSSLQQKSVTVSANEINCANGFSPSNSLITFCSLIEKLTITVALPLLFGCHFCWVGRMFRFSSLATGCNADASVL